MAGIRTDIIQVHPFRVRDGAIEHLILRRSDLDELLPGAWQVVTGGVHSGETVSEAALREVLEETGLVPLRWVISGRVATFYFAPYDAVVLSPVIACEIEHGPDPTLSDEHAEFRWLAAGDACALLAFASHREGIDDVEELVRSGGRA